VLARDNELIARTWLTLPGTMLNNQAELKAAMQLIELAQPYISQLPPQHPLEAHFHAIRGEILLRQGAPGEGVKNLRAAVAIGRELKLPELAPLLSRLSWGLSSLRENTEAASAAREGVDVSWRDFGPDHPQHARALLEWARSEATMGYRESAVAAIESAAAIEEAAYAGPSPRLAATLEILGRSYSQTGRYPEAISTFERAIEMEQSFDVPNRGNIAAAYNDMGHTYISMGEYDAARSALESALAIWQQQHLPTMIGIGLGRLGNVSNRAGLFAEAADYCRRALANDALFLPPNHPDLAHPLSCLGEALLNTDNAESALEPLERAHQLLNRIDVDESSLAWTRWLYGRALYESGRDRQLGLRYVRFARDTFTSMGDAAGSELHDVTTWLAAVRN
jgi:eukaryotic-like serine/threonine-protein kinase